MESNRDSVSLILMAMGKKFLKLLSDLAEINRQDKSLSNITPRFFTFSAKGII